MHTSLILRIVFTALPIWTNLPVTSAGKILPPPLPKSKWVNHTRLNLNYTALHDEYASDFFCMYFPTGVYGYYYRIGIVISMFMNWALMFVSDGMQGRLFPTLNFLLSLGPTGFSIYLLHQNISALQTCEAYGLNRYIHGIGVAGIVSGVLFVSGTTAFTLTTGLGLTWTRMLGVWVAAVGALMQYSLGSMYTIVILGSLHVNILPDAVNTAVGLSMYIPMGIVMSLVIVLGILGLGPEVNIVLGFGILAGIENAVNSLKLGNIIGDPWGAYVVQEWAGVVDVVLVCTVPVIQLIMLFLCGAFDRFRRDSPYKRDSSS